MKVTCHVIRDLLPLYVEGLVSDDSKMLVGEHLQECPACKKYMRELRTSEYVPLDTDPAPLEKIKAAIRKNKILAVIFTLMVTAIIAVITFAYITAPEFLPYRNETVTITEDASGKVIVGFSENVADYQLHRYPAASGEGYVYHLTTWDSIWHRNFAKKNRDVFNTVLNPDGEKVIAVYYYPGTQVGPAEGADILIYGSEQYPDGGVVTLPRLVLNYYLLLAVLVFFVGAISIYVLRRNERMKNIMIKISLLPLSYIFSHLFIVGLEGKTYTPVRDIFAILLGAILFYMVMLIVLYFLDRLYRKKEGFNQ